MPTSVVGAENNSDIFTTVQSMDGFRRTDAGQVTVALIGEDKAVRPKALDGGSQSGCTSVGGFLPIDVQIVVDEDGAAYGRDADSFVFHAHFFDDFGNELVYHAVAASRTVVHRVVVHQRRFFVNQVFGFDDIFFCHNCSSLSVAKSYEELHHLEEDGSRTDVDKGHEVVH